MRRLSFVLLSWATILATASIVSAAWHYDFDSTDITGLNVTNPTGVPTYVVTSGALQMNIPSRSGGGSYSGYDLASWVNNDALRFLHSGGGEPFSLETSFTQYSTYYTFISGLYLFSNDGSYSNDLVFGANSNALKIDRGSGTSTGSGTYPWTNIGSYTELFLQVIGDGSNNYDFNYKTSSGDSWTNLTSMSGFSFDNVGIITKTWYNPSPAVTADFDYLYYNYSPVPIPGAVWLLGSGLIGLVGIRRKFMTS